MTFKKLQKELLYKYFNDDESYFLESYQKDGCRNIVYSSSYPHGKKYKVIILILADSMNVFLKKIQEWRQRTHAVYNNHIETYEDYGGLPYVIESVLHDMGGIALETTKYKELK